MSVNVSYAFYKKKNSSRTKNHFHKFCPNSLRFILKILFFASFAEVKGAKYCLTEKSFVPFSFPHKLIVLTFIYLFEWFSGQNIYKNFFHLCVDGLHKGDRRLLPGFPR